LYAYFSIPSIKNVELSVIPKKGEKYINYFIVNCRPNTLFEFNSWQDFQIMKESLIITKNIKTLSLTNDAFKQKEIIQDISKSNIEKIFVRPNIESCYIKYYISKVPNIELDFIAELPERNRKRRIYIAYINSWRIFWILLIGKYANPECIFANMSLDIFRMIKSYILSTKEFDDKISNEIKNENLNGYLKDRMYFGTNRTLMEFVQKLL
jgi:hypothetical protein